MRAAVVALLLAPAVALAQPRPFSCVGAEALEDDVFAIPFARGADRLGDAARAQIDAAVALALEMQERPVCVLGHADRGGGAQTSVQLAAQRARAVTNALVARGVERDRIRAEARVANFSHRVQEPGARAVTIVVMPPP